MMIQGRIRSLGFEMANEQILSEQFHPEASPGPRDVEPLFHRLVQQVRSHCLATRHAQLAD